MTSNVRHVRRISKPCCTIVIWGDNPGNRPTMRDIIEPERQKAARRTAPNRTLPVTSTFTSSAAFGFAAAAHSRPTPRQQITVLPSNSRSMTIEVSPIPATVHKFS